MAVPPCYADLGKSAKDIFNKGYGMDWQSSIVMNEWIYIWSQAGDKFCNEVNK